MTRRELQSRFPSEQLPGVKPPETRVVGKIRTVSPARVAGMDILIGTVAVLGVPAALAGIWVWTSRRNRRLGVRRRGSGDLLGMADEIFRPQTHQAQQIQKIQHELPAPAPSPGEPPAAEL